MKRKALIIGINYKGTSNELHGCINDALRIRDMAITNLKFLPENIILITDDTEIKPTKENIWKALNKLFEGAVAGDQYYIHYSGHGASIRDRSGDEKDGYDETLCPLDFNSAGFIVDDDIRAFLTKIPAKVKIFGVFDSCHSGTAMDLRYLVTDRSNKYFSVSTDSKYPSLNSEVVLLSGAIDSSYSYDVQYDGKAGGALTFAYLEIMKKYNYNPARKSLLQDIRDFIIAKRLSRQNPQMSMSQYVSIYSPIF
jgi:hypothetical protein